MTAEATSTIPIPAVEGGGQAAEWHLLAGEWQQVSAPAGTDELRVESPDEQQPCYLATPRIPAVEGTYRVRTRLLIDEPTRGTANTSAELLFNTRDLDNTYRLRFRVRTGVRYLTLTKHVDGRIEELLDDIVLYDFDRWLDVEVAFEDNVFDIAVDGERVATGRDFAPLSGDRLGVGAADAVARYEPLEVTALGARPVDPAPAPAAAPDGPEAGEPCGSIEGDRYRVGFVATQVGGARTYRAELFTKTLDETWLQVPFDDRLVVLTGSHGSRRDLFASLERHWVSFTGLETLDPQRARLCATDPGGFTLTATWDLAGHDPRIQLSLTPETPGHHVIGYLGLRGRPLDQVDEVLCGPMQHAKMVRGVESIGLAELSAPLGLVQHTEAERPLTIGLYVPADQLAFEYEPALGDDAQPFGMSLRDHEGQVRPVLYAPQYGDRSLLAEGATYEVEIGLYARPVELFEAYRELLRHEYGYRAYRRNVFESSLTDTMHNLIDLLASEPSGDDSVDFRPSPSGWWSRAKGFIDIENVETVRATTTSVLLSAYYLTADDELYERRALPTIEYHLSRNGYGWTPISGRTVYGDPTKHRLCSTPFGAPAMAPLHSMLRGRVAAASELAMNRLDAEDYWLSRTPMSSPLAGYRMTGDPALLRRAEELGRAYVAEHIARPYEDNVDAHDFQHSYSKAWVDLLELYEETGDSAYLDAAYREAKRYVSQVFVRPVPAGSVTVPIRPFDTEDQIAQRPSGWWDPDDLFDYPRGDVDDEEVPRWVVSPNGMSFEAMKTYRLNGYTNNPAWAPSLLRLAHHVGDDLLRDVAHNAVVGRYTNYPGYYYRQLTVHHMKPDFPYTGPFGNTTIYYHHAPVQLGMTIDYLLTEHETRSDGNVAFPSEYEQNYVWFAYRVFGHRPGRVYGNDDAWLWMPRRLVSTGNPQINWVSAEGGRRLYVSLTSESDTDERVRLRLDPTLVPMEPGRDYPVTTIRDNQTPTETSMHDGRLNVAVSAKGITVVIVHDVGPFDIPSHREVAISDSSRSFHFDDDTPVGAVRGILIPRPDGRRCHAYIQAATDRPATLHFTTGADDQYRRIERDIQPNEWTIPIDGGDVSFTYSVQVGDQRSEPVRLTWTEHRC